MSRLLNSITHALYHHNFDSISPQLGIVPPSYPQKNILLIINTKHGANLQSEVPDNVCTIYYVYDTMRKHDIQQS